jgi:phage-related protein
MVAVLRHPHKVVLNVIEAVRTLAIFCHQDDILPEGAKAIRLKAKALDLANGSKLPEEVQDDIGYVLHLVQHGETHSSIKPLTGKDLGGVYEIRSDFDSDTYQAVYAVNLGDAIYMLHVFQKKSKRGKETPKPDMDVIRARLKRAKEEAEHERTRRH